MECIVQLTSMSWESITSFFVLCFLIGVVFIVGIFIMVFRKTKKSAATKIIMGLGITVLVSILLFFIILYAWIGF
ncbi:hypothetical protein DVR12_26965 [Chitinophaga silvatica]|uniref:Uncharacterized protein n=1 Tax=Chitinophaga silvatica TaxID=2282649 RepID=A0A3E1Y1X5_9BACT|nr:hypothetical protein DVR12_26965 [Chitinophaga silvatica]